jgi:hypothetical protein
MRSWVLPARREYSEPEIPGQLRFGVVSLWKASTPFANCICPARWNQPDCAFDRPMSEERRGGRQGARMHLLNQMADPPEVGRVALLRADDAAGIRGRWLDGGHPVR